MNTKAFLSINKAKRKAYNNVPPYWSSLFASLRFQSFLSFHPPSHPPPPPSLSTYSPVDDTSVKFQAILGKLK